MPKKQLTIEKKMNNALVPEEEWPYKLPDNWCWVRLGELFQVNPKNNVENDDIEAAFIPMALIDSDFSGEYSYEIKSWKEAKKGHTQFANKDVAFAKISPCFENGKAFIANNLPNGIGAGTTELVVLRNIKIVPQYTFYLLSTDRFVNGGRHTYSGVVGQQRISMDYVKSYAFPLPPLSEQQRIVNRIKSLFAKLDEAKEKIQNVLDGAEKRKAAILHQAFTGKLTAKWRKENGVSDDSWEKRDFKGVAEIKSNLVDPISYQDFPHIAPDNIEKKTGELLDYNTVAEDKVKSGKHRFYSGQILYSKIRPYLSKVVMVDFDGLCSADMYPIEARDGVSAKYLWYYMLSDIFLNQASTAGSRTVLPKINQKELNKIKINITVISEQKEIVRLLDKFLNKEKSICKSCEVSLAAIEAMKKAILAKAFRGELGTNNPAEKSSKELLREIISI